MNQVFVNDYENYIYEKIKYIDSYILAITITYYTYSCIYVL